MKEKISTLYQAIYKRYEKTIYKWYQDFSAYCSENYPYLHWLSLFEAFCIFSISLVLNSILSFAYPVNWEKPEPYSLYFTLSNLLYGMGLLVYLYRVYNNSKKDTQSYSKDFLQWMILLFTLTAIYLPFYLGLYIFSWKTGNLGLPENLNEKLLDNANLHLSYSRSFFDSSFYTFLDFGMIGPYWTEWRMGITVWFVFNPTLASFLLFSSKAYLYKKNISLFALLVLALGVFYILFNNPAPPNDLKLEKEFFGLVFRFLYIYPVLLLVSFLSYFWKKYSNLFAVFVSATMLFTPFVAMIFSVLLLQALGFSFYYILNYGILMLFLNSLSIPVFARLLERIKYFPRKFG